MEGRRRARVALVNPDWSFPGSVYFGCREPHLPLEFGYSARLLEREGHEVLLADAHLEGLSRTELRERVAEFRPDWTAITTAPSYLFWRCPQPELRVPMRTAADLAGVGGALAAVGPHGSSSPGAVLRKMVVRAVVRGECEVVLPEMAAAGPENWGDVAGVAMMDGSRILCAGGPREADLRALPALRWPSRLIERHRHHHHRFDGEPDGPGAEMETSRGCPYRCAFCTKEHFRGSYRKRPLPVVLEELDALVSQGVRYVYMADEIFLPDAELLGELAKRPVRFGVQTRIDLWDRDGLDLLGKAGCVSIEAGMESIHEEGRRRLRKPSLAPGREMEELLVHARRSVPFVQANLVDDGTDSPEEIEAWRERLRARGVWASPPVPLFPYPGSEMYRRKWGEPDDFAWERAHEYYVASRSSPCELQDAETIPLEMLETSGGKTP